MYTKRGEEPTGKHDEEKKKKKEEDAEVSREIKLCLSAKRPIPSPAFLVSLLVKRPLSNTCYATGHTTQRPLGGSPT